MNNLVSKFETMTAVDRKYQYVWKGRITALTTGEFLYLDGSATKELPFVSGNLYFVSVNADNVCFGKNLTTGIFDGLLKTPRKRIIYKNMAGVYETYQNDILTNSTTAIVFDDVGGSLIELQGAFVGNRYEFEVTNNVATDDYDVFFVLSLDEVINVAVYTT